MKSFLSFCAGCCATMILVALAPLPSAAVKAIKECESSLTRNQVCELYAKPKQDLDK